MVSEYYTNNGQLIAQTFDMGKADGNLFPTPDDVTFQLGIGVTDASKSFKPHMHKRALRQIETTSEFLFVLDGQMTVVIYDEEENVVGTVVLTQQQCLLQFFGGHDISLEPHSKYFEIKQGPYFGRDFDKYDLVEG